MRESVQMLKEQLLLKGKELQKLNAEKEKHDAKMQYVITASNEKIEDLKATISEKEGAETEGSNEEDQKLITELQESNEEDQKIITDLQESLDQSKKEKDKLTDD